MLRFVNHALAASAACILAIASIGAIVAVPPADAAAPASFAAAELA